MLNPPRNRDLARQPLTALAWWCIPTAIGATASVLLRETGIVGAIWALAFGWMGTGCTLNARRCHRLHCYISAPVLFVGAVLALLLAVGIIPPSVRSLSNIVSATLVLVLLSFLPEMIWGRYRH